MWGNAPWRARRAAVLAGVVALISAACGGDDDAADTTAAVAETAAPGVETTAGAEGTAAASGDPIVVGAILDGTGPLAGYGVAMMAATTLAIEDINANGGVLGRPLELDMQDAQSDIARYTTLAGSMAGNPDMAVVQGGITSASREAIRPIFDEAQKLYFYNVLYEGGVCDKNTFVTGETPTQQLEPLLAWAAEQGLLKWYVLAANYNYGQISADWVNVLAGELGAEIVGGPTFFDLTIDNFTDQIPQIQASGADTIVSLLVGAGHNNFYKQWATTGLNETTTVVSPVYGFGEEQVALGADGAGIVNAFSYFQELDTPASAAFLEMWQAAGNEGTITPGAVATWNGWHLWAAAAEQAGSIERDAVIAALEGGLSYDGPAGVVTIDPGSHHTIVPMRLWEGNGEGGFTLLEELTDAALPSFEQEQCDLIANPETNEQFTP